MICLNVTVAGRFCRSERLRSNAAVTSSSVTLTGLAFFRSSFVNQLAQHRACESGLTGGIGRELQALGATLIDRREHVAPENRLITDDRYDAIDG